MTGTTRCLALSKAYSVEVTVVSSIISGQLVNMQHSICVYGEAVRLQTLTRPHLPHLSYCNRMSYIYKLH